MLRLNFLLLIIVTLHLTRTSVGVTNAPPPFSSTKNGATTNEFLYINVIVSFLKGKLFKLLNYYLFIIIIFFLILDRSIYFQSQKCLCLCLPLRAYVFVCLYLYLGYV